MSPDGLTFFVNTEIIQSVGSICYRLQSDDKYVVTQFQGLSIQGVFRDGEASATNTYKLTSVIYLFTLFRLPCYSEYPDPDLCL